MASEGKTFQSGNESRANSRRRKKKPKQAPVPRDEEGAHSRPIVTSRPPRNEGSGYLVPTEDQKSEDSAVNPGSLQKQSCDVSRDQKEMNKIPPFDLSLLNPTPRNNSSQKKKNKGKTVDPARRDQQQAKPQNKQQQQATLKQSQTKTAQMEQKSQPKQSSKQGQEKQSKQEQFQQTKQPVKVRGSNFDQGQLTGQAGNNQKTNIQDRQASQEKKMRLLVDPDDRVDKATLREMEKQKVFPLKKKSIKFPRARFFCRLCEYHLDRVIDYRKHVAEPRHKRRKEVTDAENTLRFMPAPTEKQIHALDALVEQTFKEHGLTEKDVEERKDIVKRAEEFIHKKMQNVFLQLYGSSLTGFGMKSADVNIDMYAADMTGLPKLLTEVFKLIQSSDQFDNVYSDFSAKVPVIVFTDPKTKLECRVTINSRPATATSQLLSVYSHLDPRVRKLAVAFRYWAKVCRLDLQSEGTLPAYATSLMTVFFLQHVTQPLLPVLTKNLPKNVDGDLSSTWVEKLKQESSNWASQNTSSVGILWLELLRFFSFGFDSAAYVVCLRQQKLMLRAEKKWNSKKLAIEDPFSQKRNVARTVSNTKIYEYFQDSLRKAYHYFGLPRNKSGESLISDEILNQIVEKLRRGRSSLRDTSSPETDSDDDNTEEVHDSGEDPDLGDAESSPERQLPNTHKPLTVLESRSSVSTLCDEDLSIISAGIGGLSFEGLSVSVVDSSTDEGKVDKLSPSVGTEDVKDEKHLTNIQDFARDFALDVVACAVRELYGLKVASPSSSSDELKSDLPDEHKNSSQTQSSDSDHISAHSVTSESKLISSTLGQDVTKRSVNLDKDETKDLPATTVNENRSVASREQTSSSEDIKDLKVVPSERNDSLHQESDLTVISDQVDSSRTGADVRPPTAEEAVETLVKGLHIEEKDCLYEFSAKNLTDGKGPAIICGYCDKEGHLKTACPEDQLPKLSPLPPVKKSFMKMISMAVDRVPRDFGFTQEELDNRDYIVWELETFIRHLYPGAELKLFGSSCNGFGFRMSDLDICMTFSSQKTSKEIKCAEIIERLAKKLREHKGLYNVVAIPTAKVPIVKFRHRQSQLEGDISLYNILAQHNTKLLLTYSEIDPRVRSLGYAFKVFAKICDIGDASRGSLSSYAYVLMLLHYLQQCDPPVIPVLQELYQGKKKPEVMVDDCNAYFFDDLTQLPRVWKDYGRNRMSVGDLWLGLFRFYTEEFNYKEMVVCIRQKAPLSRFEKLWNGKCLAIEDPFDLNHNLGAGLSRKMNNYILRTLINGRELYGTPKEEAQISHFYMTLGDYFFDRSLLSEGAPPNDRGCRVCGKIGHIAKECPIVTNRKEREEKERRQREERARANRKIEQNTVQHSSNGESRKSHSSPNTPSAGQVAPPPGFREKPQRSKSLAEGETVNTVKTNPQMSPPPGYQAIPIFYDPQHRHVYVQNRQHMPPPVFGDHQMSPGSKNRPEYRNTRPQTQERYQHQYQSNQMSGVPIPPPNYIQLPMSQMMNMPMQSPPTPGQQIMMAISPQKHYPGMGQSPPEGFSFGSPGQHHNRHQQPQQPFPPSPRNVNSPSGRQITRGSHQGLNITVPNDLFQNQPK